MEDKVKIVLAVIGVIVAGMVFLIVRTIITSPLANAVGDVLGGAAKIMGAAADMLESCTTNGVFSQQCPLGLGLLCGGILWAVGTIATAAAGYKSASVKNASTLTQKSEGDIAKEIGMTDASLIDKATDALKKKGIPATDENIRTTIANVLVDRATAISQQAIDRMQGQQKQAQQDALASIVADDRRSIDDDAKERGSDDADISGARDAAADV